MCDDAYPILVQSARPIDDAIHQFALGVIEAAQIFLWQIDAVAFRITGPVYTVFPDGHDLQSWCESRPDFSQMTVA